VIVAGFLGAFAFLIPVVLIHNLTVAAVCLSLAFLFAELIVGRSGRPMDIAPRYAGTASGMMNFVSDRGSDFASSFGYLVDRTGSWVVPFIASIFLLLLGAVLAWRLRPDRPSPKSPPSHTRSSKVVGYFQAEYTGLPTRTRDWRRTRRNFWTRPLATSRRTDCLPDPRSPP